jgi:hypothetical protein
VGGAERVAECLSKRRHVFFLASRKRPRTRYNLRMVRLVAALALSALFMGGTAGLAWAQEHVTTNPDPARGSLTFQSDPAGAMRQARSLVAAGDLPGARNLRRRASG